MGLSSTAALVSIQDANGAAVNQTNGGLATVTPGTLLNFALQSTSGVAIWNIQFNCPNFPSLHQRTYQWVPGQANLIQVQLPPDGFTGSYTSVVSDGTQGSQTATGTVTTSGVTAVPRQHGARLVAIAALAAYTNSNGTITANANGAMATVDGVAPAVGDFLLIPPGIAAAAADVGVYQVTSLGGASSKFVLNLSPDWPLGGLVRNGTEIRVEEGTVMAGTTWVVTNTGNATIGTTTFTIFPRSVTQSITLVAGTATIANVPVMSATKTNVVSCRTTANTSTATTGGYHPVGAMTTGALGTASIVFDATVAAGTINNADISTLAVTVINPC